MQGVNVVCDFDGTIALEDVTDSLLERFADPSWTLIEEQWRTGAFGSRECMARQVALVEAKSADLDRFLDTIEIDATFPSFVAACERSRVTLNIVSDGIDYAVRRVLANHALGRLRVQANALVALPHNRYRLEFPHAAADCGVQAGTCKCAIARRDFAASRPAPATILIGDGTSDFCIATHGADFVFAKDRLLVHCEAKSIPHLPFDTFADIERELAQVIGGFEMPVQSALPITETRE